MTDPIRRRTPEERAAYLVGYRAGAEMAVRTYERGDTKELVLQLVAGVEAGDVNPASLGTLHYTCEDGHEFVAVIPTEICRVLIERPNLIVFGEPVFAFCGAAVSLTVQ